MIAPPAQNSLSQGDSDSDWDDDDDFATKKINIKIKPVAQVTPSKISASVDELRATVGTWKSLASINLVKPNSRRHHQSTVNLNNGLDSHSSILGTTRSSVGLPERSVLPDQQSEFVSPVVDSTRTHDIQPPEPIVVSNGLPQIRNMLVPTDSSVLPPLVPYSTASDHFVSLHQTDAGLVQDNPLRNGIFQLVSQPTKDSSQIRTNDGVVSSNGTCKLPVAFSIQESLSLNGQTRTLLIGTLKMAVPPCLIDLSPVLHDEKLQISIKTSRQWEEAKLNSCFIEETENPSVKDPLARTFTIDMAAVQSHVKATNQKRAGAKYYLLPELLKYAIVVPNDEDEPSACLGSATQLGPLGAVSHWLCDINETKVKIDLRFLEKVNPEISMDDINNLSVSVRVNGGVVSHHCKPEAGWDPRESRLTWSFASLAELIRGQSITGAPSCLARFGLSEGPSSPLDVSLRFSIPGKTVSGAHVLLNGNQNFRLAKQRLEARAVNHGRA